MDTERLVVPAREHQAPYIRIVQIDVLRGYALLGIYWINVIVFGLPGSLYGVPNIVGDLPQLNIAFWGFSEFYVEGTMRGLFSLLFGASALVFLDEAKLAVHGTALVDRFYRRNMLLIVFGLLHAYLLLWPYDVLYDYGLIGMFLFPLRKLSPRLLLVIGVLVLLLGEVDLRTALQQIQWRHDVAASVETHTETDAQGDGTNKLAMPIVGIDAATRESIMSSVSDDIEARQRDYLDQFVDNADTVVLEETVKFYTTHVFDIGGMMLIGMALLKLGVLSGERSRGFYLWLMLGGYGIGLLVRGYIILRDIDIGFNPDVAMQGSGIDYNFGRLPVTLGHVGLIGLLCKISLFDRFNRILARLGRMALTNYIMQTLLSVFLFYGIGLGLYGKLQHYQLLFVILGMWTWQAIFSTLWFRYFKQGPLEWVWRSLIYGQRQALRKRGA